jgi:uncharacterized membrane protein
MAVASYASRAAAERDFEGLCPASGGFARDQVAAALVEKGADGRLTVEDHRSAPEGLVCGTALLGGALIVVAAPLGVIFLVPVLAATTTWAGVGALVAHLWNNIPKGDIRHMSDLVEAAQSALVVVALDRTIDQVKPLLGSASSSVVTDIGPADLEAEFCNAVDEACTTGG